MNPILADQVYSDLRRQPDGTYIARCPLGWHEAGPGDAINFGNGVVVELLGPSQIGGGSFIAGAFALIGGMALMVVAAALGWGV